MGFFADFLRSIRQRVVYVNSYGARGAVYGKGINQSDICRAIFDCNAAHMAKADIVHVMMDDKGRIAEVKRRSEYTKLFYRPNPMMSGYDFLYALSWQLDSKNTALAWVDWDKSGNNWIPRAIWPLDWSSWSIAQTESGDYACQFTAADGSRHTVWLDDMVVLRRHYDAGGFGGLGNEAIDGGIKVVDSLDDSLVDAVDVSNKVHGLLKKKNGMLLSGASVDKGSEDFATRVANAKGGVVMLDASEEYQPIALTTWTANALQMQEAKKRLHSYWRTPEEVVNGTATEQTMQNYYEGVIEPRWHQLGQALTAALFTRREVAGGHRIMVSGGPANGVSMGTAINLINATKELGIATKNEYRMLIGWNPVDDGDKFMASLNYIDSSVQTQYQTGEDKQEDDDEQD